jgi:uncharacterized protein (DUF885 family)
MKTCTALLGALILAACSPRQGVIATGTRSAESSARLHQLSDQYFQEYLQFDPLLASDIGESGYDDQLAIDISESYRNQLRHFYARYLEKLDRLDTSGIDETDRLNYLALQHDLKLALEGLRFPTHLLPIDQLNSLPVRFPLLASGVEGHSFGTPQNYDDFIARTYTFTEWVDTAIANMRLGVSLHIVQPKPVIERTIPQLRAMIVDDPRQSVFYAPVTRMPAAFSAQARSRITAGFEAAIRDRIVPAYRKLLAFLESEYLPACRETAGMSALPGGREWYAYLARYYTTTDMPVDSIYQHGVTEVERIQRLRQALWTTAGVASDYDFRVALGPRSPVYGTADSLIAAYAALKTRVRKELPRLFERLPRADFEIRQVEPYREASAPSQYVPAPPDGSRPAIFYVNTARLASAPARPSASLFLHEAIPGHHLQMALQREDGSIPMFRRFGYYGAYIEGWGLYAESLGGELGLYLDTLQLYNALGAELARAKRLVVDVGLHAKGWTRDEAIDYLVRSGGVMRASAEREVDRYLAMPGQALAYKVGQMEILDLRRRAQQALGDRFDIREFHGAVLDDGALPLDLLEAKIEEWIGMKSQ